MKGSTLNNPARGSEDPDDMHDKPKPRTRSPEHAAASLCKELAALDAAEAKAKVAAKERADKRERLLNEAGEDVLKMAQAMRGAVSK